MEGTIIPLPSAYAGLPTSVKGERDHVAVATIEFVPAGGRAGPAPGEILHRVQERCVRAGLVTLGRHGITPVLAGTTSHPVIEGVFEGEEAEQRAATASLAVIDAVHDTQRVQERFLAASAGLAHGTTVHANAVPGGHEVQVTTGSPMAVADRLREGARAGEMLLGGEGWAEVADELGAHQLPDMQFGAASVPVWCLGPDHAEPTDDEI